MITRCQTNSIAIGGNMQRSHARGTAIALLLNAIVLNSSVIAQIEYDAVLIEPWNQSYSLATSRAAGINNNNVVSGCASPLTGSCSFLWTVESGKEQVNLGGAINDDGYVAGTSWLRSPDGTLVEMPGLGGARDMNNDRVVVGAVTGRYWGGCRYTRHATVWDEANGSRSLVTDFGVVAAHESRAINNAGEIVGVRSSTGSCGDFEAFYLNVHTGEHIDIHAALLGTTMGLTQAYDINDDGFVIGTGPVDNQVRAFLWSRDDGFTFLPNLPGTVPSYSNPSAINNHGTVVGAAVVNDEWRAWVWDADAGVQDLNDVADGIPADFVIEDAIGINDNGWIIARGHYGSWSPERAIVLIPRTIECQPDMNGDSVLDFFDVQLFLAAFAAEDAAADFVNDGVLNFFDVQTFLQDFADGCP